MSLYSEWGNLAPDPKHQQAYQEYWNAYFEKEKDAYKKILAEKSVKIKGIISELASNYNMTIHEFVGFLDGINESIVEALDLESLEKESEIEIEIDHEKLLFNMHKAKADWLYGLAEWDGIFDKEKQKEIKKAYSKSGTVHKEEGPGRNDPCPCGSGKKYKKCCGAK